MLQNKIICLTLLFYYVKHFKYFLISCCSWRMFKPGSQFWMTTMKNTRPNTIPLPQSFITVTRLLISSSDRACVCVCVCVCVYKQTVRVLWKCVCFLFSTHHSLSRFHLWRKQVALFYSSHEKIWIHTWKHKFNIISCVAFSFMLGKKQILYF